MPKRTHWIWVLLTAAALFASTFWLGTLQQPLIDQHEFRQTQTALSALFMQPGLEGLLNYQTPVLGAPWSIPFELPLFQWLSHQLASLTGMNLSASGRLMSILFGVGCLWPASRLMRRAGLGIIAVAMLIVLYCTSSIYLYWNRAFLMESMALFFTLLSLDAYSQIRHKSFSSARVNIQLSAGLVMSLSLGLLVKATTALPALVLITGDLAWQSRTALKYRGKLPQQLLVGGSLAVAFALLYSWTHHADALKQLNPIGTQLTSSALRGWNFGTPAQRLQPELWLKVVSGRMLVPIAAIPIIVGLRISSKQTRTFLLACLILAFAPLLIFTNLHVVHSYYQVGNHIFLLMAVAGSAASVLDLHSRKPIEQRLVLASLTILIVANLVVFLTSSGSGSYWAVSQKKTSTKLAIGRIIESQTPSTSSILVFGDDWSSAFAYHSQRRTLALPDFILSELGPTNILRDSDRRLGGHPVGAVVSNQLISEADLLPSCKIAKHKKIEEWHLYLCQPLNTPKA